MTAMLDLERILELAVDGARANWLKAIEALKMNPTSKNMMDRKDRETELRQVSELQRLYLESTPKDYHSSLRDVYSQLESIRNEPPAPEYLVRADLVGVPENYPSKTRRFWYSTLEEARHRFCEFKTMADVNPGVYHIRLFKEIRKGHVELLDEIKPSNLSKLDYHIDITHKSGDIQTLHFDDIRAAKATFELMKYEVQANRIVCAFLIRYINGKYDKQLDLVNILTLAAEE